MIEFEPLFDWARPSYIKELSVIRQCDQGTATVVLFVSDGTHETKLELMGLNEFDSLPSMLEAERVSISKQSGTQVEYGSIRIECFGDSYSEYCCDSHALGT